MRERERDKSIGYHGNDVPMGKYTRVIMGRMYEKLKEVNRRDVV